MYNFFARTLMGYDPHWVEQPIDVEDVLDLTWFRGEGKAEGFADDEDFFAWHQQERAASTASLSKEEKLHMLSWISGVKERELFTADPTVFDLDGLRMEHDAAVTHGGVEVPFIRLIPQNWDGKKVCLALSGEGKDCVDKPAIRAMLKDGVAILSGDLFMLGEVVDGICAYIDNPHITAEALRAYIKGPDFPTGGLLAPGSDAGAWAVPHGSMTEEKLLEMALGRDTDAVLEKGIEKIKEKF